MTMVADEPEVGGSNVERLEELGADRILTGIKRNCYLIYVTVRAWAGRYMMRNAEVKIEGNSVSEELRTNGSWKLIPPSWQKELQPFESQARKIVRRNSVPFKDGVYVVPKTKARELIATLREVRSAYLSKVAEFQDAWPDVAVDIERRITRELGEAQWVAVSKLLPDTRQLAKLYDIEIGLWPVGGGGAGLPVECLDDLEAASQQVDSVQRLVTALRRNMNDDDVTLMNSFLGHVERMWLRTRQSAGRILDENLEEWMGEAQAATNRLIAQAVDTMVSEPVQEFSEAVNNLLTTMDNGRCRLATIESVRAAYDKLRGFSFMMPEDLMERLRGIEVDLGQTEARTLNSGSIAGARLAESLRSVSQELASDVARANGITQFRRSLDV